MSAERALTALTQCRALLGRAHAEMSLAIAIANSYRSPVENDLDPAAEASRIFELPKLLARLETLRSDFTTGPDRQHRVNGSAARRRKVGADHTRSARDAQDGDVFEGEFPQIGERLVVSPAWGHVHRRRIREGARLNGDRVIADLRSDGRKISIYAPESASFLSWLVDEGALVSPGRALARVRP